MKKLPRNNRINDYHCIWVRKLRERRARQKIFTGLKHDWRAPRWLAGQLGDTWNQLAKPFKRGGKKTAKEWTQNFSSLSPQLLPLSFTNKPHYIYLLNDTFFKAFATQSPVWNIIEVGKKNRIIDILTYYSWKSSGINKKISNGSVLFHHVPGPLNPLNPWYSNFFLVYSVELQSLSYKIRSLFWD